MLKAVPSGTAYKETLGSPNTAQRHSGFNRLVEGMLLSCFMDVETAHKFQSASGTGPQERQREFVDIEALLKEGQGCGDPGNAAPRLNNKPINHIVPEQLLFPFMCGIPRSLAEFICASPSARPPAPPTPPISTQR